MSEYIIYKRKSIRRYKPLPLEEAFLVGLRTFIDDAEPLFPSIRYQALLRTRDEPGTGKAPHDLVFYSEKKEGALENIGYIGQKVNLYLAAHCIGACWHMERPRGFRMGGLHYAVSMVFGRADEPLLREKEQFARKSLAEISEGTDCRIEAARLAPSALNLQDWFFVARYGRIDCYRKRYGPFLRPLLGRFSRINIGIAICHVAECTQDFHFTVDSVPERNGWIYVGTAR